MTRSWPLLMGLGFAADAALTQPSRYLEVTAERLPAVLGQCMDAAAGDADGDGDLDLALAMEFEPNRLLLNDGRGRFAARGRAGERASGCRRQRPATTSTSAACRRPAAANGVASAR